MINTIIPIKFAFQKYVGNDPSEELLRLIGSIQKEDNSLIRVFLTPLNYMNPVLCILKP